MQKRKSFSQQKITILLVISGLKMSAEDAFARVWIHVLYDNVRARKHACVYDRASPQSSTLFTASLLHDAMNHSLIWCTQRESPKSHDMTAFGTAVVKIRKKKKKKRRKKLWPPFFIVIVQWCISQIYSLIMFASAIRQWQTHRYIHMNHFHPFWDLIVVVLAAAG